MKELKARVAALPTLIVEGKTYLSCQAVTDAVAAFLFRTMTAAEIGQPEYRRILKTADVVCRELGYEDVARLAPPQVPFSAAGLYWRKAMPALHGNEDDEIIIAGPGRVEELRGGRGAC